MAINLILLNTFFKWSLIIFIISLAILIINFLSINKKYGTMAVHLIMTFISSISGTIFGIVLIIKILIWIGIITII